MREEAKIAALAVTACNAGASAALANQQVDDLAARGAWGVGRLTLIKYCEMRNLSLTVEEDHTAGGTLSSHMKACNDVPMLVPHQYHRTWTLNAYPLHPLSSAFDRLFV